MRCSHCGQDYDATDVAQQTADTVVCVGCARKSSSAVPALSWPSEPGVGGEYVSACGRYTIALSPAGFNPFAEWCDRPGPDCDTLADAQAWCGRMEKIGFEFKERMTGNFTGVR